MSRKHVRQQSLQLPAIRELAQVEDIEFVAVYFFELLFGLWAQVEEFAHEGQSQREAELRGDALLLFVLLVKKHAVVLEAVRTVFFGELLVPGLHYFLAVGLAHLHDLAAIGRVFGV